MVRYDPIRDTIRVTATHLPTRVSVSAAPAATDVVIAGQVAHTGLKCLLPGATSG
jgi:hypothetical protein